MFEKLRSIFRAPGSPYSYVMGPSRLGIGVENAALVRPIPPIQGGGRYGPKYNVRGTLFSLQDANQYPVIPTGPMTDLKANGVYMSGQMALQALADFEKGRAK